MKILAIETSCDDTGVALLDIKGGKVKIIADFVSSQTEIHSPFGGVVPNLAVRAHYKNLPILLEKVLGKINPKKIDLVATTNGPGLEPCLWAGVNIAKVLAKALDKPMVGVNHLEGHIAANWLGASLRNYQLPMANDQTNFKHSKLNKFGLDASKIQNSKLFPAVCLIVSGGHTQLVLMKNFGEYKILGQTRDDAAGEAFDKVAKLLNLGYPGGPQIALLAKKGDSSAFNLPRPMIGSNNYDFSFSGLKTAVLYLIKNLDKTKLNKKIFYGQIPPAPQAEKNLFIQPEEAKSKKYKIPSSQFLVPNLCASFQQAAIDVLIAKTIKAAVEYKVKTIMLGGGVAANQELRKQMSMAIKKQLPIANYQLPILKYCADNAAMIGLAGYWKYQRSGGDKIENIIAKPNLNL